MAIDKLELPPFPTDVKTHPLLIIDYQLIKAGDPQEIERLWKAATDLGFWYLKNHGTDELVEQVFQMGSETMALPLDEKMKFEQGDEGQSFGYKAVGKTSADQNGSPDQVEFLNISEDDALAYPVEVNRGYPELVNNKMKSIVAPFIRASREVTTTLLNVLNNKLGLPEGFFASMHLEKNHSRSEIRLTRKDPMLAEDDPRRIALAAHTDFGSLSFLHNITGGLQVMVPHTNEWQYIKPIPGHAICNLGDAMKIMSGGILESNLHRVVAPPGDQANFERWSLVYFSRPDNSVVLSAKREHSELIEQAMSKLPPGTYTTTSTSEEWYTRRLKNFRVKNYTGPETWKATRGTEHRLQAV